MADEPKSELTDDEILARANKIQEQREIARIEEEKRAEKERLEKEAAAERQKQLEAEKRAEEVARAKMLVDEEKKKAADAERMKEAERQAEILKAEEAKRAAEAEKAAKLAEAKKLVAEDKKANPVKKKHTGLKIVLVIILILAVAGLVGIFSFGISVEDLQSSGAVTSGGTIYDLWIAPGKEVILGDYRILVTPTANGANVTSGTQQFTLTTGVPYNDVKDKHVAISFLWGKLVIVDFNMSIQKLTYTGVASDGKAHASALINKGKPVTGEFIINMLIGTRGLTIK